MKRVGVEEGARGCCSGREIMSQLSSGFGYSGVASKRVMEDVEETVLVTNIKLS
jgi:hypothetical protein